MKILAVAPYIGLKEKIKDLAEEEEYMELDVVHGNLKDGLKQAISAEEQGYKLIVSRGGTARLIEEHVSIPVIDIGVSGYDVLRVLTLAKDYSGNVAILGFPTISNGAAMICDLLNIDITAYTIYDESEVKTKIDEIREQGFDVIIGDVVTIQTARQFGLQHILITSGTESVKSGFENAKKTYRYYQHFLHNQHLLKSTLYHSNQASFILDKQGQVVFSNEQIIENPTDFLSKPSVTAFLQNTSELQLDSTLLSINNSFYPVSTIRQTLDHQTYTIVYVDPPKSKRKEINGIRIKEPSFSQTPYPFSGVTGNSQAITNAIEKLKAIGNSNLPVWLSGESGTGKDMLSQLIHESRTHDTKPLMQIDASLIDNKDWNSLLSDETREIGITSLSDFATLYIKNLEYLSEEIGKQIGYLYDENENGERRLPWLMASSQKNIDDLWKDKPVFSKLYRIFSPGYIRLPSLRERKEDINDLIRLFIGEFNSIYGKEVVGFQQSLLDKLHSFSWPGNVEQLKRVTERLILEANGPYVKKEGIDSLFSKSEDYDAQSLKGINLSDSLAEIERQIIWKVLQQENMNQSKAASRLGISRTTLWRKLK